MRGGNIKGRAVHAASTAESKAAFKFAASRVFAHRSGVNAAPLKTHARLDLICAAFLVFFAHPSFALEKEPAPLQPPHGLMQPGYWEQYGGWVFLVSVGVGLLIGLILYRAFQPPLRHAESPAGEARRVLQHIGQQPKDSMTASRVSRAMKRYLRQTLKFFPGEMTTAEVHQALATQDVLAAELTASLGVFFQQCDEWSFSANPMPGEFEPVQAALNFVEQVEAILNPPPVIPVPPQLQATFK